jgi:hypothetical protein
LGGVGCIEIVHKCKVRGVAVKLWDLNLVCAAPIVEKKIKKKKNLTMQLS